MWNIIHAIIDCILIIAIAIGGLFLDKEEELEQRLFKAIKGLFKRPVKK